MEGCAEGYGLSIADIDWFVPHQANQRILNGVAKRLNLDKEQVISTVAFTQIHPRHRYLLLWTLQLKMEELNEEI